MIVVEVVPAQEHLPYRPAVHEDDGRHLHPRPRVRGEEELAVNLLAVRRLEDDLLRHDELRRGEVARERLRGEHARGAARERHHVRHRRRARVRAEVDETLAVARDRGTPLDLLAGGDGGGTSARDGDAPDVSPVYVAAV